MAHPRDTSTPPPPGRRFPLSSRMHTSQGASLSRNFPPHRRLESLVAEDDGAVVILVSNDSSHGLVDRPHRLLNVPLIPGQRFRPPRAPKGFSRHADGALGRAHPTAQALVQHLLLEADLEG